MYVKAFVNCKVSWKHAWFCGWYILTCKNIYYRCDPKFGGSIQCRWHRFSLNGGIRFKKEISKQCKWNLLKCLIIANGFLKENAYLDDLRFPWSGEGWVAWGHLGRFQSGILDVVTQWVSELRGDKCLKMPYLKVECSLVVMTYMEVSRNHMTISCCAQWFRSYCEMVSRLCFPKCFSQNQHPNWKWSQPSCLNKCIL